MNSDETLYIIPPNFKNGKYIFNKYSKIDLILLVCLSFIGIIISVVSVLAMTTYPPNICAIFTFLGIFCIFIATCLTININYYHNLLGKLICHIRYAKRTKRYIWKGIAYLKEEE